MPETRGMPFIVLLAALIAERFLQPYQRLREAHWFERWLELHQSLPISQGLRDGIPGLVGLLLPLLLLASIPLWLFDDVLYGIPGALLAALVLLYSLGPADLSEQVDALVAGVKTGDGTSALTIAEQLPDEPLDVLPGGFSHKAAMGVLMAAQRRIFGALFWFLILGPLGALTYRLAREARLHSLTQSRPGLMDSAAKLLWLLDWLPARMLAGLFCLAGCFESAVQGWKHCALEDGELGGPALVLCSGEGALRMQHPDIERLDAMEPDTGPAESAMALVWRSLLILVVLCGLIAISAWIF